MSDEKKMSATEMRIRLLGRTSPAERRAAGSATVHAERVRCVGLLAVAEQAARLGVIFDAEAAVRSRLSVKKARSMVMDAAADCDDVEISGVAVPQANTGMPGEQGTLSAQQKRDAWARGLKRSSSRPLSD
jgi:hypothetical protein